MKDPLTITFCKLVTRHYFKCKNLVINNRNADRGMQLFLFSKLEEWILSGINETNIAQTLIDVPNIRPIYFLFLKVQTAMSK